MFSLTGSMATVLASFLFKSANSLAAMLCDQHFTIYKLKKIHIYIFSLFHPVTSYAMREQQGCTIGWKLETIFTGRAAAAS